MRRMIGDCRANAPRLRMPLMYTIDTSGGMVWGRGGGPRKGRSAENSSMETLGGADAPRGHTRLDPSWISCSGSRLEQIRASSTTRVEWYTWYDSVTDLCTLDTLMVLEALIFKPFDRQLSLSCTGMVVRPARRGVDSQKISRRSELHHNW